MKGAFSVDHLRTGNKYGYEHSLIHLTSLSNLIHFGCQFSVVRYSVNSFNDSRRENFHQVCNLCKNAYLDRHPSHMQ